MIPSLTYLVWGHTTLSTNGDHAARLLDICRLHAIPYGDFYSTEAGDISLRFTIPDAKKLLALCGDMPVTATPPKGLPSLIRRLLRRPGILVGGVLGLLLLVSAGNRFWDIRVSGNETLSDAAVKASLASVGLSVGSPIRGFEADVTENQVLLLDDRLAWLSVNRKGVVAYVEVREAVKPPVDDPAPLRDMVASMGGVIEYVELESGNVRVKAGQTVSEGQVLVSGIYQSDLTGIRVESASARVFARTAREFCVKIPLSYEEKRYLTGDSGGDTGAFSEKSLLFFGRHIKFSKKYGNFTEFCDIMEDEKSWGLVGGVGFPVSTRTLWYLPYEMTTATRTYAEAEELAYFELSRYIADLPGGATLTGKTVTVTRGKDFLLLSCTLTAIEDIATERVIEVEP